MDMDLANTLLQMFLLVCVDTVQMMCVQHFDKFVGFDTGIDVLFSYTM
jgi:hypothetical protein